MDINHRNGTVPRRLVGRIKGMVFRSHLMHSMIFAVALLGALVFIIPFAWTVTTSLKPDAQVMIFPPKWIPSPIQWRNYYDALVRLPFDRFFLNTAIVTLTSLVGDVIVNAVVAYGFARMDFPGREPLFYVLLATMMLPSQVTMIPVFIIFRKLGWIDTFYPLIVPSYFGNAFYIFLLRQFFRTIPDDLEHAARIDGANQARILWSVILPLSGPAIATVAVFSFMFHWQDFFRPLIYINSTHLRTISLGLQLFKTGYGGTVYNQMMAATVVCTLPSLILFFATQRYFISGIVMTGMKN